MSEEKIKLTAIIKVDIRNPFSNLVFNPALGSLYDSVLFGQEDFTKESILRMFRNIIHGKSMQVAISSNEIKVMHSLQGLFISKATIDELEIIAEISSDFEFSFDTKIEDRLKKTIPTTLATLKLPRTQIVSIFPTKDFTERLTYLLSFNLSGGAALVAY